MRKLLLRTFASTLFLASTLAPLTLAAQAEPVKLAASTGEVTGTVVVVSTEKRMLTIRKADESFQVIHVPPEVRRLDEIKIGDALTIAYIEAVAVGLEEGPAAGGEGMIAKREVDREQSAKPAGTISEQVELFGTVEAVDAASSTVTIRGPQQTVAMKVQDPALLQDIAVGDRVKATYIKAVAARVEAAATSGGRPGTP
jgi:hypothetical protein